MHNVGGCQSSSVKVACTLLEGREKVWFTILEGIYG